MTDYFTALVDGAGLAAKIAADLAGGSAIPRVHAVEPKQLQTWREPLSVLLTGNRGEIID